MKIETFRLADLHKYEQNARHNDQTAEMLKEIIGRYGYLVPLVVTSAGDIVAGHARYKALMGLGVEEVPCVVIEANDELVKEFRLFDNLIHDISKWDNTMLSTELRDLDNIRGMFPTIELAVVNPDTSLGAVSEEEFAAVVEKLSGKFEEKAGEMQARLVNVHCHGCGEKFKVLRKDLV